MATAALVSLEEYLSTIYDPDREYVDGELLERNRGESDHSGLQMVIAALLYNQRREYGIQVFPELRIEDRVSRMEVKIDDYLSFGVRHIWLIDPLRKKAWSYAREGKREPTEVLTTAGPPLSLSLNEIFAALSEAVDE